MGGRALFLGYEGFFTVNILLCFCEHFSHACLGIFGDGKHQVFRLNPLAGNEYSDRELLVGYIYFPRLGIESLDIRPQDFLLALLDGQQMITWFSIRPGPNEVRDKRNGQLSE